LNHQQVWAVVLAGGDGTRLRSLTKLISGEDRPKQFCHVYGGKTLLAQTRSRLARAIHPERTAFVLVKTHERFYRSELADVEPHQLIVQPGNKGTTAAVICSLLRITSLAPDPVVAFFPTDHYYANELGFIASVDRAVRVAQHHSDTLVVLGAEAEHPEVEYGWIEPGTKFGTPFTHALLRVRRFWEKPPHPTAQALLDRGCLWNTFVMVGRASLFLTLLANTLAPGVLDAFVAAQQHKRDTTNLAQDNLWASLTSGDFSHQVLTPSTQQLAVLRVGDIGWSDLGTPERVRLALARSGVRPWWQESAENEPSEVLAKTSAT
jgi:mannose-1-phosphate guanylyltransferase